MRVAVTGHMDVSAESVELIRTELSRSLTALQSGRELVGVSCIAKGADSIFAEVVLAAGGALEVVLPSPHYREKKVKPDHAQTFDRLIADASRVRTLPFTEVNKDAYEAANEVLINDCDRLLAVWDGKRGERSGTATVVEQAESRNVPVTVIWPDGASREGKEPAAGTP